MAEKRVDFGYNASGQFTDITRYGDVTGTTALVTSINTYDPLHTRETCGLGVIRSLVARGIRSAMREPGDGALLPSLTLRVAIFSGQLGVGRVIFLR